MSYRTGQKMNIDKSTPRNQDPNFKLLLLHPKYLPTWLGMGFIYLCKFLPYKVVIFLGTLLGHLLHGVSPHRKQIAKVNIQLCFPEKNEEEIDDLVKGHFKNMGIGVFEIAIAWWSSTRAIDNLKLSSKNVNIFKELEGDLGIPHPKDGDLTPWAKQGVLLLNATLTVRQNEAGSHQGKGWEIFTDQVIREVNNKGERVVFILWGAFAQKKKELIDLQRHVVIESVHPSPLSAYRGFFGSCPFGKSNEALSEAGVEPINWNL